MDSEYVKEVVFTMLPALIGCFFSIVVTLVCDQRWLAALLQLPVWGAVVWWIYALRNYYKIIN